MYGKGRSEESPPSSTGSDASVGGNLTAHPRGEKGGDPYSPSRPQSTGVHSRQASGVITR